MGENFQAPQYILEKELIIYDDEKRIKRIKKLNDFKRNSFIFNLIILILNNDIKIY